MSQVKVGIVVSTKMQKTIVVEVEMRKIHPLYKKIIKKSKKIKVHDELGAKMQQKVKIRETKPISKEVYFETVEVIK